MPNTIVHFEIPADDVARAKRFYEGLFGWKIEEAFAGYHLINTGEGNLGGGMMRRQAPQQPIITYVGVSNIDEGVRKAQSLGAQVLVPKQPVPNIGWFAHLLDSEGNLFALFQDDESAG